MYKIVSLASSPGAQYCLFVEAPVDAVDRLFGLRQTHCSSLRSARASSRQDAEGLRFYLEICGVDVLPEGEDDPSVIQIVSPS